MAECWLKLEAALLMATRAAQLYDAGQPCAAEANGAKYLGARAGYEACLQAVLTHGGMGYAKEFHVERLLREVLVNRIGPVTEQLILCFIAERVLGQPKSVLIGTIYGNWKCQASTTKNSLLAKSSNMQSGEPSPRWTTFSFRR